MRTHVKHNNTIGGWTYPRVHAVGILILIPSLCIVAVGDLESGNPVLLFAVPSPLGHDASDKGRRTNVDL